MELETLGIHEDLHCQFKQKNTRNQRDRINVVIQKLNERNALNLSSALNKLVANISIRYAEEDYAFLFNSSNSKAVNICYSC